MEAKAPISDSNSRFLMVQWGEKLVWPRPLCRDSQARGFQNYKNTSGSGWLLVEIMSLLHIPIKENVLRK